MAVELRYLKKAVVFLGINVNVWLSLGEVRTLSYITLLDATDYSSHNPGLASGNGKRGARGSHAVCFPNLCNQLLRNGSYKAYALSGGVLWPKAKYHCFAFKYKLNSN